nr:Tn3 family transposase [Streptomyces sp. SJL17-1]
MSACITGHRDRAGRLGRSAAGGEECRARLQRLLHPGDRRSRALKYGRLSHVDQTYLRPATYRAANATLIGHQASIGLAQAWGGGLVASAHGMRFVGPVPSVYARPNPKHFGRRGGATSLNMINDQAAGLGGKVAAGTPRDSRYVLDVHRASRNVTTEKRMGQGHRSSAAGVRAPSRCPPRYS